MPEQIVNWRKEFALSIEKQWDAKSADGKSHHYVSGNASDMSLDRDGDRMSGRAIDQMKTFVDDGMNFYADHKHGLFDMLGVLTKAENKSGHLWVEARLEDPDLNPQTKLFLHKLDIGEKIGLSIGGDLRKSHMDGPNRVIDDVVLYEISAVGIPSNANAYLLGSVYKSADFKPDAHFEDLRKAGATAMRPGGSMGHTEEKKDDGFPADKERATGGKDAVTSHECAIVHAGITHGEWSLGDSTVKALRAKTEQLEVELTALKQAVRSYGASEQPNLHMDDKLPPAATHVGTADDKASGKYPDKDTSAKPPSVTESNGTLKAMANVKKEADTGAIGGQQTPPDAGTVPAKLEEGKPSEKPGSPHEDTAPAGKPGDSTSKVSADSMGTGSTDKGSFSQTDDKDEEAVGKLEEAFKSEDDEEAKKALAALINSKKAKITARKAKREAEAKLEDQFAAFSAGKKAEEGLRGWRAKIDEALGGAPVGAGVAGPSFADDDEEAKKESEAFKGLVFSILDKFVQPGSQTSLEMKKEYESAISSVFSPKSGTENMTNLRSPGQPEAKVAAEPGKSGSSEVFRSDSGSKGGLETMEDAKKNPPASLDTVAKEPIGTYDTPTKLTSGTGYQMPLLRGLGSLNRGKLDGRVTDHTTRIATKSFKTVAEMDTERLSKEFPRLKPVILPRLKSIDPNRVPSTQELEELIKSGKLSEDLVNPAPKTEDEYVYVDSKGNRRKSVLTKGIVDKFSLKK